MARLKISLQGARASDKRVPLARTEDLAIEEFEDELLVYDRKAERAHCLGATAARVWRACDGSTDIGRLADALDLSRDTVLRALDELEASQLLDVPEVQVLDGNGNGITRRQLTARSAKIGAAAAAAPLVYSIAVPTPAAAASPDRFVCALYSVSSCGSSVGGSSIAGCCCCCNGCSGTSCVVSAPRGTCPTDTNCPTSCCPGMPPQGCNDTCTGGQGSVPASTRGCCGQTGATNCGCAWSSVPNGVGSPGNVCGGSGNTTGCPSTCGAGSAGTQGCGAGCCVPGTGGPGGPCIPGAANCVPCCNGFPIPEGSPFGCCIPGDTNTCTPTPGVGVF